MEGQAEREQRGGPPPPSTVVSCQKQTYTEASLILIQVWNFVYYMAQEILVPELRPETRARVLLWGRGSLLH